MFSAARSAKITNTKTFELVSIGLIAPEALPETYTLAQLYDNVCLDTEPRKDTEVLRNVLILYACLGLPARLSREDGDEVTATKISIWLSRAILPTNIKLPDIDAIKRDGPLKLASQKAVAGLLIFENYLPGLYEMPPKTLDTQILLSLIAFSPATFAVQKSYFDPWTTPTIRGIAEGILSKYGHQTQTSYFVTETILQKFIRPVFSKAKRPEAITSTGRKAMASSAPPRKYDAADNDPANTPWMYQVPYAITVLEWAVMNSTTETVTPSFNLYLPPLLTLLDSTHSPTRCRALFILFNFLPLLSDKFLIQSGLSEVFEDAVTPTLMFLPNITPVEESVPLLEGSYQCLIELGIILYGDRDEERQRPFKMKDAEEKYWDRLMRKGLLSGYAHSGDHPEIAEVLLENMALVVRKMNIYCVKHLKDIIPIATALLSDPFTPTRPKLLLTAETLLHNTISCAHSRVGKSPHRLAVMTALALCWKNIYIPGKLAKGILVNLQRTAKMLLLDVEEREDVAAELKKLYEADESMRLLFGTPEQTS